jgi:hypothetical protein
VWKERAGAVATSMAKGSPKPWKGVAGNLVTGSRFMHGRIFCGEIP